MSYTTTPSKRNSAYISSADMNCQMVEDYSENYQSSSYSSDLHACATDKNDGKKSGKLFYAKVKLYNKINVETEGKGDYGIGILSQRVIMLFKSKELAAVLYDKICKQEQTIWNKPDGTHSFVRLDKRWGVYTRLFFNELTDHPKIFVNQFANQPLGSRVPFDPFVINRNKFAKDLKIKEEAQHLLNTFEYSKDFDHPEVYRTVDGQIVFICSNYDNPPPKFAKMVEYLTLYPFGTKTYVRLFQNVPEFSAFKQQDKKQRSIK